jgi:hypothetical protein
MADQVPDRSGRYGRKEDPKVLKKLKEHWSKPAPSEKYPKWDHPDDNPGNSGSLVKK